MTHFLTTAMTITTLASAETFPFRDTMSDIASSPYWIDYGAVSLTPLNCPGGTAIPRCVQLSQGGELYFLHFNLINVSDITIEFNLALDPYISTTSSTTTSTTLTPGGTLNLPTLSLYHSCDASRWNMATWTLLTSYTATKPRTLLSQRHKLPASCDHALDFNLAFIAHFETAVTPTSATIDSFAILPRTDAPTKSPTRPPTKIPTLRPTTPPTTSPTQRPTLEPSTSPTEVTAAPTTATHSPTMETRSPTRAPSAEPTNVPTTSPSKRPTQRPTLSPTESTYAPTVVTRPPTTVTQSPTESTRAPTMVTNAPTKETAPPTRETVSPSADPTVSPSEAPTIDLVKYLARFNPTATTTPSPVVGGEGESESDEVLMPTERPVVSDGYREMSASPTAAPTKNGGERWSVGVVVWCVVVFVSAVICVPV